MNPSVRFWNRKHVQRVLARALACSMLLVLPACGIPPLRLGEPGPPLPSTFNGSASPVNSALLGLGKFFNDPVLLRLLDQALASNRELRVLNEEVEVARNEYLARRGAFLPLASFQSGVGVDKHSIFTPLGAAEKDLEYLPGKHFPDPVPDFLLRLNFLIPLDIWRELRNARDAAFQRYLAASERRNYFVTRLVAEVAENYYGLMALDNRLEILNQTIRLFQDSLKVALARYRAGRGTTGVLPVRRFEAEVARNRSELLIVGQEIIEVENRINFLVNRVPQPVERLSARFFNVRFPLSVGVPAQLLQNRPDIRQAERELTAAGLDIKVARAHFFPRLDITGGIGYEAFSPKYLFWTPDALIYNVAGELTAPLINKVAIRAEYRGANARQLESVYNYQRVILNAFTEVVNRLSRVQNYSRSLAIKQQQVNALQTAVDTANKLFVAARVEYIEVLLAQRDRLEAMTVRIQTRREQLAAIINTYQALGGGDVLTLAKRMAASGNCDPSRPGQPIILPEPDDVLPAPRPEKLPEPEMLPEPKPDGPKPAGKPTTANDQQPVVSISLKVR